MTGPTNRNHTNSIRRHWPTTTLTAPCQRLNHTHAPPLAPFTQRRFTTPRSDQTPGPGSALHPHSRGASTDHDPLPPQGLPSGQTLVKELPQTPLPEQPAAVHSSAALVSAPVRLPVQLFARLNVPVSAAPSPALCSGILPFELSESISTLLCGKNSLKSTLILVRLDLRPWAELPIQGPVACLRIHDGMKSFSGIHAPISLLNRIRDY